jgi:hypothetical protein
VAQAGCLTALFCVNRWVEPLSADSNGPGPIVLLPAHHGLASEARSTAYSVLLASQACTIRLMASSPDTRFGPACKIVSGASS